MEDVPENASNTSFKLSTSANPLETNYLYFVASGIGKEHNFSSTINDHNKFVAGYRKAVQESHETQAVTTKPSN
jgi:cell division protein YceG involved in septum cleavage